MKDDIEMILFIIAEIASWTLMTLDYGIVSENDFLALNVSLHY